MSDITAIETEYNGYRFRSRLEARWAVFLDALAIDYRYEPEGYDLGKHGLYLPDFWLPDLKYVIEVKGRSPTKLEEWKVAAVCDHLDANGFIVGRIPTEGQLQNAPTFWGWNWITKLGVMDEGYVWCECKTCGRIEMQFDGRSDRISCKGKGGCPTSLHGDKGYNWQSNRLIRAYALARKARFEYGETPDPHYLREAAKVIRFQDWLHGGVDV